MLKRYIKICKNEKGINFENDKKQQKCAIILNVLIKNAKHKTKMSNDVEKVNQNMRKKKKKRQKIMEMNKKGLI